MNTYYKAVKIHDDVITIDTHCDIDLKNFTNENNYSMNTKSQVNIPKIKEGGLDVPWLVVYTAQDSLNDNGYKKAYENAINKFDAIHTTFCLGHIQVLIVGTTNDYSKTANS